MNKSPHAGHQANTKAWLQQATEQLASLTTPERPARSKNRPNAIFLVVGLVILQGVILLAALAVAASRDASLNPSDNIAALDVSTLNGQILALTEPPPPPTPTPPPLDIFERYGNSQASPGVARSPVPVVTLRGVEITQGIQVFQEPQHPRCLSDPNHPDYIFCNNSMPMVAGRHTLLRAYVACNGPCPAGDTVVRLRLFKDGQEYGGLTRVISAAALPQINNRPMPELRLNLNASANFEFFPPPAWMAGQVTFQVEAASQSDPAVPAISSLTKDFAVRKPLRIAYLPIEYQGLRPPDPVDVDYWLQRMYPVSAVEYFRLPMPDLVWEGDVGKSDVLRKLLYTYWLFAQYNPTNARPDQLFGWLPQELYNGGAADPFWCPECAGPHSSRVAFGGLRPEQDIGGPRILAHEIAHNLGAQHAWSPTNSQDVGCFKAEGADIQVDPAWPYAQTPYIQEVGIDLYSNPPVIQSPSVYDMMAYCTQPWISPHTYRKIFDSPFLQPHAAELFSFTNYQPQVEATQNGTLLVSGVVYPNGNVSQPEVIKIEGDAFGDAAAGFSPPLKFTPPAGDDYCLDVRAADDSVLAQHCFDVGFVDIETGQPTDPSPFFFTLPGLQLDAVKKISVIKNRVAVVIVTPSNNPPQVAVTYPNGGEVLSGIQTITWDAHDKDGDALTFDALYSLNGGQSWLPLAVRLTDTDYTFFTGQIPASNQALIRVIANDGFNTTTDQSDGPFTLQALPANSISLLGPTIVEPGQIFEVAVVANQVAEPGLFGVNFELEFNPGQVRAEKIRPHAALDLVVNDTIQNDNGRVSLIASRAGRVSNLTGQITLATVTFTALQQGQLNLDVRQIDAGARGGIRMPITEVYGLSVKIVK
jgi:hypothetical protein